MVNVIMGDYVVVGAASWRISLWVIVLWWVQFYGDVVRFHDDVHHGRVVLRWQQLHVCQWNVDGS